MTVARYVVEIVHFLASIDTRRVMEKSLGFPFIPHRLPIPECDLFAVKKSKATVKRSFSYYCRELTTIALPISQDKRYFFRIAGMPLWEQMVTEDGVYWEKNYSDHGDYLLEEIGCHYRCIPNSQCPQDFIMRPLYHFESIHCIDGGECPWIQEVITDFGARERSPSLDRARYRILLNLGTRQISSTGRYHPIKPFVL